MALSRLRAVPSKPVAKRLLTSREVRVAQAADRAGRLRASKAVRRHPASSLVSSRVSAAKAARAANEPAQVAAPVEVEADSHDRSPRSSAAHH